MQIQMRGINDPIEVTEAYLFSVSGYKIMSGGQEVLLGIWLLRSPTPQSLEQVKNETAAEIQRLEGITREDLPAGVTLQRAQAPLNELRKGLAWLNNVSLILITAQA